MQRLSPFYYLDNFACMLRLLRERDHDLLLPAEHAFMQEFFDLPHEAQALTARVAARSVAVLPESSLCYPELSHSSHALTTLTALGWLRTDPVVTMEDLFGSLPLFTLATGFGLNPRRTLNKAQMLNQARELYPAAAALSQTHFRIREVLYQFVHGELCHRLCAQYFGTLGLDWSRYVLRDLGIRRYECVPFDAQSRPFRTRAEVQCFHQLEVCRQRLEAGNDPAAVIEGLLPQPPSACEWLQARYQNTAYRLAQRFERDGDLIAALALYRSIESPEAGARAGIVSRRQRGERPTPRPIKRLVPHFDLSVAGADEGSIERRVADELQRRETGSDVQVVENRLFNALFGLLFWRVLFEPVRGAFFHAFQSAPADLHGSRFRAHRESLIEEALASLRSGEYPRIMRQTLEQKRGLSNPWIAWRWLRSSMLDRALDCIPAPHLYAIFEWMLSDLQRHVSGFPDLIQFWPEQSRYRLIEVKLGADRLRDSQQRFLRHATSHDMPIVVCYVTAPASRAPKHKVTALRRRIAQQGQGCSLELFA